MLSKFQNNLTKQRNDCIIEIENESHRNMCATIYNMFKHHIAWRSVMWCFYYLLKITTIAIIKANAIIVIPTKT